MKKNEIKDALDALKEIKIHKIEDKELRNDLIANHFALLDAGKKNEAAIEARKIVLLEAYKEEEEAVQELQAKINEAATRVEQGALARELRSEHADYLKAVKAFNDEIEKLLAEEVEGLKPIDRNKFMEAIEKQDFKLSWVEALYPMFVL